MLRTSAPPIGALDTRMQPVAELLYTVHEPVPTEEAALIDAGLGVSNESAAPLHEVLPLSCFARLPSGAVIGGVIGRTWGICCELQQLWVEEEHRRQGIGGKLVREFELHAQLRGCQTFYLETFSFQAPSLYSSLGYEVKLELRGFAPGVVKYTMVRQVGGNENGANTAVKFAPVGRGTPQKRDAL